MNRIVRFLAAILIGACMATALLAADRGPSVLFIAIDDLNDWTSVFDNFQHMRPQSYPPEKLNGAPDYEDGSEELYDHDNDPNEWINVASNPDCRETMDDLRKRLPSKNAKPCADLKKPGSVTSSMKSMKTADGPQSD